MAQELRRAFEKFCNSPNRELVYNLYTYLWDIVSVVLMLVSYVDWLSMGRFSNKYKQLVIGRHTWFSGIREAFCSGDHEPWVFRGGLAADLQRLMPVDSGNDLFLYPYPDAPTSQIYTIRPFVPDSDTAACYSVALQTWDDGIDATQYFSGHPTLPGEKTIGAFINFYPEFGFVLENSVGEIVGFVFAAPNIREYHQRLTNVWLPELRFKFPLVESGEGELLTPGEVVINSLHKGTEPAPAPPHRDPGGGGGAASHHLAAESEQVPQRRSYASPSLTRASSVYFSMRGPRETGAQTYRVKQRAAMTRSSSRPGPWLRIPTVRSSGRWWCWCGRVECPCLGRGWEAAARRRSWWTQVRDPDVITPMFQEAEFEENRNKSLVTRRT